MWDVDLSHGRGSNRVKHHHRPDHNRRWPAWCSSSGLSRWSGARRPVSRRRPASSRATRSRRGRRPVEINRASGTRGEGGAMDWATIGKHTVDLDRLEYFIEHGLETREHAAHTPGRAGPAVTLVFPGGVQISIYRDEKAAFLREFKAKHPP